MRGEETRVLGLDVDLAAARTVVRRAVVRGLGAADLERVAVDLERDAVERVRLVDFAAALAVVRLAGDFLAVVRFAVVRVAVGRFAVVRALEVDLAAALTVVLFLGVVLAVVFLAVVRFAGDLVVDLAAARVVVLREGTFAPFLRASERPIAMACARLFTVFPLPDFNCPLFFLCIASFTDF